MEISGFYEVQALIPCKYRLHLRAWGEPFISRYTEDSPFMQNTSPSRRGEE